MITLRYLRPLFLLTIPLLIQCGCASRVVDHSTQHEVHPLTKAIRLEHNWTYLDSASDIRRLVGDERRIEFYVHEVGDNHLLNITHVPEIGRLRRLKSISVSASADVWPDILNAGGFESVEHVYAFCHTRPSQALFDWLARLPNLKSAQVLLPSYEGISAAPLSKLSTYLTLHVLPGQRIWSEATNEISADFVRSLRDVDALYELQIDGTLTGEGQWELLKVLDRATVRWLTVSESLDSPELIAHILSSQTLHRVHMPLSAGILAIAMDQAEGRLGRSNLRDLNVSIPTDELDSLLDIVHLLPRLGRLSVELRGNRE